MVDKKRERLEDDFHSLQKKWGRQEEVLVDDQRYFLAHGQEMREVIIQTFKDLPNSRRDYYLNQMDELDFQYNREFEDQMRLIDEERQAATKEFNRQLDQLDKRLW